MAEDLEETKRLLALEYEQLRNKINTFDDMRFKVKGWCLTVAGGLLFLAIDSGHVVVSLLALGAALCFTYIEAVYITREEILFHRSDYIEEVMESIRRRGSNPTSEDYAFGIRHSFSEPTPRSFDLSAL